MNKLFLAAAFVCLFAFAAFAQKPADLSGKWNLDISKSELGQQAAMIKSQTVTITQAGTSFKVSTQTERNAPPDGGGGGGGMGFPGGGLGYLGGGGGAFIGGADLPTDATTPSGPPTSTNGTESPPNGSGVPAGAGRGSGGRSCGISDPTPVITRNMRLMVILRRGVASHLLL